MHFQPVQSIRTLLCCCARVSRPRTPYDRRSPLRDAVKTQKKETYGREIVRGRETLAQQKFESWRDSDHVINSNTSH